MGAFANECRATQYSQAHSAAINVSGGAANLFGVVKSPAGKHETGAMLRGGYRRITYALAR